MNQSNLIILNLFLISSFQNDASWAINSFWICKGLDVGKK